MIAVADLRAWVGAADTTENNALLTQLEAYAVAEVELQTGAYLGVSGTVSDRVIGDGTTQLRLPKYPVTAVASVAQSTPTDVDPDPVDVTEFALRSPLLIRTGGATWTRDDEFEITYTAGYAADAFPSLYHQAVLDIVKATYDAQAASLGSDDDVSRETLGEYSYELASSVASLTPGAARGDAATILSRLPRRLRV